MAEIVARFADGRLLVQEDRVVQTDTISSGYATVRIGYVRTVEKVLSIDGQISGYPDEKIAIELRDVQISGNTLQMQLRRSDLGVPTLTGTMVVASGLLSGVASGVMGPLVLSGGTITFDSAIGSGALALAHLSGITSGLGYKAILTSGRPVSGQLRILANVIGF